MVSSLLGQAARGRLVPCCARGAAGITPHHAAAKPTACSDRLALPPPAGAHLSPSLRSARCCAAAPGLHAASGEAGSGRRNADAADDGASSSAAAACSAQAPSDQHAAQNGAGAYPHVSVLLREILQFMEPVRLLTYLDCTLGAGGHATELARAHQEMNTLVGIDLDPAAHQIARARLQAAAQGRSGFQMHFLQGNYSDLKCLLGTVPGQDLYGKLDGILMDLGVSSMQLDTAERGFSFMRDGPIDMRMDPSASMSAEEVLNTWSEADLGRIIRDYGEEKLWRVVARRIVQARENEPIRTTQQLAAVVGQTQLRTKGGRRQSKGPHPATRTFQALRIVVNDELQKLEQALPSAIDALAPGGRLAVISFHSLEDRLVKYAFLRAAGRPTPEQEHLTYGPDKFGFLDELERSAVARLVTRKPVEAAEDETAANPRARSAKLRVLEKMQA